jgi:hypothetical protein
MSISSEGSELGDLYRGDFEDGEFWSASRGRGDNDFKLFNKFVAVFPPITVSRFTCNKNRLHFEI